MGSWAAGSTEHPSSTPDESSRSGWTVYVDLDAYYVSCELRERPELRGRPVIVGPDPKHGPTRGVVLSASYEARARGVRSAMPAIVAARACPEAVWLPADFPKYVRTAREFVDLLRRHAPEVVPHSIDEAAVAIPPASPAAAEKFGRELQRAIRAELDLPSSIGIAPYRIVAKIATDRAKPGGVIVVPAEEIEAFLAPLPVRAIPGIGPKTEAVFADLGVETIGDLAEGASATLRERFGSYADELVALARGTPHERDESGRSGPRSRSIDRTFDEDLSELPAVEEVVGEMAEELGSALESEHLRYRTVSIAVRWADFTRVQRSRSFPSTMEGSAPLRSAAVRLLDELWDEERRARGRPARLVSVRAERLEELKERQKRLDDFPLTAGRRN